MKNSSELFHIMQSFFLMKLKLSLVFLLEAKG